MAAYLLINKKKNYFNKIETIQSKLHKLTFVNFEQILNLFLLLNLNSHLSSRLELLEKTVTKFLKSH